MTEESMLGLQDVAGILEVSPKTVRELLKAGRLRGYCDGHTWRIPGPAVREYLRGLRLQSADEDLIRLAETIDVASSRALLAKSRCPICARPLVRTPPEAGWGEFWLCQECGLSVHEKASDELLEEIVRKAVLKHVKVLRQARRSREVLLRRLAAPALDKPRPSPE